MSARADHAADMDVLVGYVLLVGVLSSLALLAGGLAWRWSSTGTARLDYDLAGTTVFQLLATDVRQLAAGAWRPRLLVNDLIDETRHALAAEGRLPGQHLVNNQSQ